jgi:hypothetical protein
MTNDGSQLPGKLPGRRYRWPWLLLGLILLGLALAVVWMEREVERTRRIRDLNAPQQPAGTDGPGAPGR